MTKRPCLTAVTLGVRSVPESARFYEALGFVRKFPETGDEIAFFDAGGLLLAVWDGAKLAEDSALPIGAPSQAFRGVTLAWNCATNADVDAAYERGLKAGAKLLREPGPTDYGGYRGYFADPDGHSWEVVCAPGFTLNEDGRLVLP